MMLGKLDIKCYKCEKEYEVFSGFENWSIVKKIEILPFCKKCSKELEKVVDKWIKGE